MFLPCYGICFKALVALFNNVFEALNLLRKCAGEFSATWQ
jgi:hypothetical protein